MVDGERRSYRAGGFPVNPATLAFLAVLLTGAPASGNPPEALDRARSDEERLAELIGLVESGDLVGAEEILDRAGPVAERDPRWLNLRGLVHAARDEDAEAIAAYERALRSDPGFAAAHRNLAIVLAGAGQRGRAMTEFAEATRLDPGDVEAWLGLATLQTRLRRVDDARLSWDRLLQLAPGDVRTWRLGAEFAALEGDREAELEAWTWMEEHAPDAESARRLGDLRRDEAPGTARQHYLDCVVRDSLAIDCRERVSLIALEQDEPAEALRWSGSVFTLLTESGYTNLLLAASRTGAAGRLEEWVGQRPPASAEGWGIVALVRRETGARESAVEAVQQGLELAETADLHNLLGVLRLEGGDRAGARRQWRRALELDPGHAPARENLEALGSAP